MATWHDGPEYAPTQRPDAFVEPATPNEWSDALGAPHSPAAAGAPGEVDAVADRRSAPDYQPPDAAPLDALVPAPPPQRDPKEAFDVASTPLTSWSPESLPPPEGDPVPLSPPALAPSAAPATTPPAPEPPRMGPDGFPVFPPQSSAWGHAHAPQGMGRPAGPPAPWAPHQPFPPGSPSAPSNVPGPPPSWPPAQVNPGGFPQPGPPPWQAPPPQRGLQPVTLGAMAKAATPGVLICLGLGALASPLSLALLLVGSVLASRVHFRRALVGRLFSSSLMASFVLGLLGTFVVQGSFDLMGWFDLVSSWARLACVVLFVAVPLIMGDALRRGESPEERW